MHLVTGGNRRGGVWIALAGSVALMGLGARDLTAAPEGPGSLPLNTDLNDFFFPGTQPDAT